MSRPNAAAVKPIEITHLPVHDQIAYRDLQRFKERVKERVSGGNSWY